MKKFVQRFLVLTALALAVWFAWVISRARTDLVTLNVRELPLHEVIHKIQTQTWEHIWIAGDDSKPITLNVRKIPLGQALELIARQTGCELKILHPIYKQRASLNDLKNKIVQGTQTNLWTNFTSAPRPGLIFARASDLTAPVILQIESRPAAEAARELSRFSRAEIVPEDSATQRVSLQFTGEDFPDAVKQLAGRLGRKTTPVYVLKELRLPGAHSALPPPPRFNSPELREALELMQGGGPVMIRIEDGQPIDPGELPPDLLQPPDPAAEKQKLQQAVVENLRDTTPQQRVEQYRRSIQGQPPLPQ